MAINSIARQLALLRWVRSSQQPSKRVRICFSMFPLCSFSTTGPQFTLDPEPLTFSFGEPRQPSRCCFCSFMHWWKAEPSREDLRTISSLQFSIEELSLPHSDALSRSSTLINHPSSSKYRWLFGALWPLRAHSVRKNATAKLNLTKNQQSIFWGWMSRFFSTPSHNTEADSHLDNISLPA